MLKHQGYMMNLELHVFGLGPQLTTELNVSLSQGRLALCTMPSGCLQIGAGRSSVKILVKILLVELENQSINSWIWMNMDEYGWFWIKIYFGSPIFESWLWMWCFVLPDMLHLTKLLRMLCLFFNTLHLCGFKMSDPWKILKDQVFNKARDSWKTLRYQCGCSCFFQRSLILLLSSMSLTGCSTEPWPFPKSGKYRWTILETLGWNTAQKMKPNENLFL